MISVSDDDCEDQGMGPNPPTHCDRFECQEANGWEKPRLSAERRGLGTWWLCPICRASYGPVQPEHLGPPSWKPGDAVWYASSPGHLFAATVDSEPRKLGTEWVVRLTGLGPDYRAFAKIDRTTVSAAACCCLTPRTPEPREAEIRALDAVAAYADHTLCASMDGGKCDCGLDRARAALREVRRA